MDAQPTLPIPISLVTDRYLLFDITAVSYLHREHNINGVLIGSIPQSPSQNVFLGLPLELMPEEAELLISTGVAYIVDDARAHDEMLHKADLRRRQKYLTALRSEGQAASKTRSMQKEQAFREKILQGCAPQESESEGGTVDAAQGADDAPVDDGVSVVSATSAILRPKTITHALNVTPATSFPLLLTSPSGLALGGAIPHTYPLFKHLHDRGYFLSPGLRFGCQYMAYPGDPLRYHSHFLVNGNKWDDEINLMDVVGGGRLGTGVKKGYLLGGTDPEGQVKTFSIEWAGM